MIRRDRNRCGVIFWSLSNETNSSPERDKMLIQLSRQCKLEDPTRLVTSVMSNQGYSNNSFNVWDSVYRYFDVMCINEYLGWYLRWQGKPADVKWKLVDEKPLIITEFGGEARYGITGHKDEAAYWSEEYQEKIYKDQLDMFATTPNLAGVCSWLLVDYRSPVRMHPVYQNGYNRKGLISEKGKKKKAWYVLKNFYESKGSMQ
jgi:beta-glucuronidase